MRHASLFTGIGGFDLAAQWMGWENIFQVEIDHFCQKVLEKNFPNITRYGDIKQFDGSKYGGAVDIISGGFPCQPYSYSGSKKGDADDRHLWPEMLRIVKEIQPRFVVGENVHGLLNWSGGVVFERVQADLENQGYEVFAVILPACGVNAPHQRDRIWFIANLNSEQQRGQASGDTNPGWIGGSRYASDTERERCKEQWETRAFKSNPTLPNLGRGNKSGMGRGVYGVPNRVDRITGLGNSVVPHLVFRIFKAIETSFLPQNRRFEK